MLAYPTVELTGVTDFGGQISSMAQAGRVARRFPALWPQAASKAREDHAGTLGGDCRVASLFTMTARGPAAARDGASCGLTAPSWPRSSPPGRAGVLTSMHLHGACLPPPSVLVCASRPASTPCTSPRTPTARRRRSTTLCTNSPPRRPRRRHPRQPPAAGTSNGLAPARHTKRHPRSSPDAAPPGTAKAARHRRRTTPCTRPRPRAQQNLRITTPCTTSQPPPPRPPARPARPPRAPADAGLPAQAPVTANTADRCNQGGTRFGCRRRTGSGGRLTAPQQAVAPGLPPNSTFSGINLPTPRPASAAGSPPDSTFFGINPPAPYPASRSDGRTASSASSARSAVHLPYDPAARCHPRPAPESPRDTAAAQPHAPDRAPALNKTGASQPHAPVPVPASPPRPTSPPPFATSPPATSAPTLQPHGPRPYPPAVERAISA